MNSRLTAKDRGLIKGAIRRAFSRSELRKSALMSQKIAHLDPLRPRVKTWYKCEICKGLFAGYEIVIDHKTPVIPINSSLEDMTWDELVDRMWCEPHNLQVICNEACHTAKSKLESKQRKEHKKNVKSSKTPEVSTSPTRKRNSARAS